MIILDPNSVNRLRQIDRQPYVCFNDSIPCSSCIFFSWEEKLPLSKSDIENTWLYHEIGRCHLMLGAFDKARECGKKSLGESKKAEDDVWKLNAGVLIAQAEGQTNISFHIDQHLA